MIKSVSQAMPNYFMSCYIFPNKLIQKLHRIYSKFWHFGDIESKKVVWDAWASLLENKQHGGLGIRELTHMNKAFLTKDRMDYFI